MTDPTPEAIVVTTDMWDEIQAGWHRTVRSLVLLIVAVVLVLVLFSSFLAWRSYQSQGRQECITRTEAIGFGHLVDALRGAPTSADRNKKLTAAADELAKLRDVGKTCG